MARPLRSVLTSSAAIVLFCAAPSAFSQDADPVPPPDAMAPVPAPLCTTTADCPVDYVCEYLVTPPPTTEPSAGDVAPAPLPPETEPPPPTDPTDPTVAPAPSGVCVYSGNTGVCFSDADCADGESCIIETALVACDPNGDCPQTDVMPSGYCEQAKYTCASDADCPEPSTCQDGQCTYEVQSCAESADVCGAGYSCQDFGRETCSSSTCSGTVAPATTTPVEPTPAPAPAPAVQYKLVALPPVDGAAGAAATDPVPPDSDPAGAPAPVPDPCDPTVECAYEALPVCFPVPQACATDADCDGDWVCADVPPNGPGDWATLDKACVPLGIQAAFDGSVATGGALGGANDTVSIAEAMSASGTGTAAPQVAPNPAPAQPGTPTTQVGSDGDATGLNPVATQDGGCAVASPSPRSSAAWLGAALLAMAFGFARRRRAE